MGFNWMLDTIPTTDVELLRAEVLEIKVDPAASITGIKETKYLIG